MMIIIEVAIIVVVAFTIRVVILGVVVFNRITCITVTVYTPYSILTLKINLWSGGPDLL